MTDTNDDRRDAPRIQLQTQLRYREVGDTDWSDGETENISSSGILFRGTKGGEPDSAIELIVSFADTASGPGGRAICSGHIVRQDTSDGSRVSLAARISTCRVVGRATSEPIDFSEFPTALVADA